MALRYTCNACAVVQGGTTHTHGLGGTPDEWKVNLRGPVPGSTGIYVTTVNTTSIIVAGVGATGTCDVFAAVNHSIIK
mgnify:CR=1 FL=1